MLSSAILKSSFRSFAFKSTRNCPSNTNFSLYKRSFRRPRDLDYKSSLKTSQGVSIGDTNSLLAAGGALGLGGLCFYGLVKGPKDSLSAFDKANFWPENVKNRIRSTYAYLAGSTIICGATAIQLSRNIAFVSRACTGIAGPLLMMAGSICCGIVCRTIPYPNEGGILNTKHASWLVYSASLGAMVAPVCFIGGQILTQAAMYTAGIVGGLSLVGACAPSDKFLYMAGPLGIGLGVVFVSSIGSMFMSPVGRLGFGLHALSLYGGLALFSGFLLYDTQKMIHRAESTYYTVNSSISPLPYDPINNSMNILIDSINIFVRIASILANGGSRRK